MTDRDIRGDEITEPPPTADAASEVADTTGTTESPQPRRPWTWWALRTAMWASIGLLLLAIGALFLWNYGTMWPPTAEAQAEYDALAAQGRVSPQASAPGFRVPIPGCVCHAGDADLTAKAPGHVPDVTLVMAHRYRTLSECYSAGCHGGESEATEGPVQGEPLNQLVVPAQ